MEQTMIDTVSVMERTAVGIVVEYEEECKGSVQRIEEDSYVSFMYPVELSVRRLVRYLLSEVDGKHIPEYTIMVRVSEERVLGTEFEPLAKMAAWS